MKPVTSAVYTFEKMRREDFLYVDKTAFIHEFTIRPGGCRTYMETVIINAGL